LAAVRQAVPVVPLVLEPELEVPPPAVDPPVEPLPPLVPPLDDEALVLAAVAPDVNPLEADVDVPVRSDVWVA
jgi:hypothetical protein